MSKAKKFLLIAFTVGLVINLQFNAPLTRNMDNGFSIEQLADNIFVPEAFATVVPGNTLVYDNCAVCYKINNNPNCDASDPDWTGCW